MKNIKHLISRRRFLSYSTSITAGMAVSPTLYGAPAIIRSYNKPDSLIKGVQIGAITYSFRSMPDQSAEAMLQYIKESGINAIELMGDPAENFAGKPESPIDRRAYFQLRRKQRQGTLNEAEDREWEELKAQKAAYDQKVATWRAAVAMDKFTQLKETYQQAGVSIYGFKPSAFGIDNSDAEMDYGFRAAKALGADHVTLEHPSNNAHTLKLGQLAAKHNLYVAYHGHEQQTPTFWDTALDQSQHNMMNLDLGHYTAAGNPDPIPLIKAKHTRICSMHLKDRQTPQNGKANMPWGQGDTPIVEVLQLMRLHRYKFPATIELEYDIPEGSNAVKEVANCLQYCRHALQG